jgi:uncharacterized RDD family membrane protein YckC
MPYCPHCGSAHPEDATFCPQCGSWVGEVGSLPAERPKRFASFWQRLGAGVIDWLVIALPFNIVSAALLPDMPTVDSTTNSATGAVTLHWQGDWDRFLILAVAATAVQWLYTAVMNSSPRQATLGKMALGLVVTDEDGKRISFLRASGRFLASLLSQLTLGIGYLMVIWTRRKQALHDKVARTVVVPSR